jgi:hypothetical protein
MSRYSNATDIDATPIEENQPMSSPTEVQKVVNITKEVIQEVLVKNGFNRIDDDHYQKVEEVVAQHMIINGQDVSKKEEIRIEIRFIGEGSIADSHKEVITQGLSLQLKDQPVSDFWVSNLDDLKFYFNLDIE